MTMYILNNNVLHTCECRKCNESGEHFEKFSDIPEISGIKACRCCKEPFQRYCEMQEVQTRHKAFVELLQKYTELYGYKTTYLQNSDIEIATKVEKWVVHFVKLLDNRTAKTVLYHRSARRNKHPKCGGSLYPEYHIQWTKVQTPKELIVYMHKHEVDRYGVTQAEVDHTKISKEMS